MFPYLGEQLFVLCYVLLIGFEGQLFSAPLQVLYASEHWFVANL